MSGDDVHNGLVARECARARGKHEWQRGDCRRRWNSLGRHRRGRRRDLPFSPNIRRAAREISVLRQFRWCRRGTPFFPAGYNAGNDHQFAIGLQSASVILEAISEKKNPAEAEKAIREKLGAFAVQIENIGKDVAQQTSWTYEGIDLSPAPLKRDSIGAAIEAYTGGWLGTSGTLSTAALITRAIQSIPVTRAGYSGLMLPVLEDSTIARRWSEGALNMDSLLAYSAVCGTGLDTIPLPGRVTPEQLIKILGDVASLSVKWKKPLSARLLPIAGKDAGDRTDFDNPRLVNVLLRPLP